MSNGTAASRSGPNIFGKKSTKADKGRDRDKRVTPIINDRNDRPMNYGSAINARQWRLIRERVQNS